MSVVARYVSGDGITPVRTVHVALPLPLGWSRERGLAYLDEKYPYPTWVRLDPSPVNRRLPLPAPSSVIESKTERGTDA